MLRIEKLMPKVECLLGCAEAKAGRAGKKRVRPCDTPTVARSSPATKPRTRETGVDGVALWRLMTVDQHPGLSDKRIRPKGFAYSIPYVRQHSSSKVESRLSLLNLRSLFSCVWRRSSPWYKIDLWLLVHETKRPPAIFPTSRKIVEQQLQLP
jgi:hypothetical protein